MNDLEFIKFIQKYIPTKCRESEGIDFNLRKVHMLINEYIKTGKI